MDASPFGAWCSEANAWVKGNSSLPVCHGSFLLDDGCLLSFVLIILPSLRIWVFDPKPCFCLHVRFYLPSLRVSYETLLCCQP
jgi:hypothetical protein